jgi:2,4-dienoyl-CoA reductase-like NADH-dependent reductase (Old Yellow Enzyme family)
MAYPPVSVPKGPSALSLPDLHCAAMTREEVRALPAQYAAAAQCAQVVGFGGVQIHAGHGFLLSQFLSPLFNQRTDHYGGDINNRSRLLVMIIEAVRAAVDPAYPVAVKLNATDQLEGGLTSVDALQVVARLGQLGVDLIDISGGTYFPGAKSVSDSAGSAPYFLDFARQARTVTDVPLMLTGGIKSLDMALAVLEDGAADVVGLARALVLAPDLPQRWRGGDGMVPLFPRFPPPPEGGVTAWYTRALTHIAEGRNDAPELDTPNLDTQAALDWCLARDVAHETTWRQAFG